MCPIQYEAGMSKFKHVSVLHAYSFNIVFKLSHKLTMNFNETEQSFHIHNLSDPDTNY